MVCEIFLGVKVTNRRFVETKIHQLPEGSYTRVGNGNFNDFKKGFILLRKFGGKSFFLVLVPQGVVFTGRISISRDAPEKTKCVVHSINKNKKKNPHMVIMRICRLLDGTILHWDKTLTYVFYKKKWSLVEIDGRKTRDN